jgi:hypothetical protein
MQVYKFGGMWDFVLYGTIEALRKETFSAVHLTARRTGLNPGLRGRKPTPNPVGVWQGSLRFIIDF